MEAGKPGTVKLEMYDPLPDVMAELEEIKMIKVCPECARRFGPNNEGDQVWLGATLYQKVGENYVPVATGERPSA
jgi:hypothetical protein